MIYFPYEQELGGQEAGAAGGGEGRETEKEERGVRRSEAGSVLTVENPLWGLNSS